MLLWRSTSVIFWRSMLAFRAFRPRLASARSPFSPPVRAAGRRCAGAGVRGGDRLRAHTIPAIPATVSGFGGIAPCAISRPRAACLWQRPGRMVAVVVKWGKNTYEVELDTSDSVETFKAQLFALTSVPIERQKIMGVKGGTLKDDAKFDTLGIKPGQKLMMMGSADVLAAPPSATVFAEDLPQVTRALTVAPASTSPLTLTLTLALAYRRRRSTRRRRRTRLGWPTWATRATSTRRCSACAPSPR